MREKPDRDRFLSTSVEVNLWSSDGNYRTLTPLH